MGQADDSMPHFKKAMDLLGNPQPQSKLAIKWCIQRGKFTQWKHIHFPCVNIGRAKYVGIYIALLRLYRVHTGLGENVLKVRKILGTSQGVLIFR